MTTGWNPNYEEDRFESVWEALNLPDLDPDGNPIQLSREDRIDAVRVAILSNLEYCDNCQLYSVPGSHVCNGDNTILW